ncbi:MAG: Small-conductance mechanosensitive channel MscMJ [Candidatus Methanofastidiosum methylothiophilum]|uniref:Small-conductance mechanosensitive channel MscMJ n=1 Tax=Candidatus Methanofastidiosum methylothiophilum TaxID=1705564 RepID=A0A150IMC2_9EURY|nr:MAG: Small-conductance mechanosensitive channel MscMJ [Candidatus Methanofastidiosum methylthiophilus]KYC48776.1 MAG: Small-conductance mechanosensitive channel MscMJ [Candidatus Methanofastidiosum methylthiophilus]KYC51424.1 MAG: Small-conductance mechanosensitive channel MscMJ [Candidatus Methanofastidiosum methylthiophilus]
MDINSLLSQTYFDNTLISYLIFFLVTAGFVVIGKTVYYFSKTLLKKIAKKTQTKFDDILVDMVEEPLVIFIVIFGLMLGWGFLSFPNYPMIPKYFGHIVYMIVALNVAWFISRFLDSLIENYLLPLTQKTKTDLDDHLLPIIRKVISVIVFGIAIITILDEFGIEIGPMLAGLGIGGLAFALASKDLISNLFGSTTVLFDKPFFLGERIKVGSYDGTVKEIGIRTTQIETLEGSIVFIPNSKFTQTEVENISRQWARRMKMTIGLTYNMNSEKIKKAKELIREAVLSEEGTSKERIMINFTEFGDFSKNIMVIYWVTNKPNYFEIVDRINLKIMESFEKHKIEFAFPTQTIELVNK